MEMRPVLYDWESFTLSSGESDYDVATERAALFNNIPVARNIVIFHNKAIKMRFNSTLSPLITAPIYKSPFQSPERFLEVKNLFLTNDSGSDATIEVFLW